MCRQASMTFGTGDATVPAQGRSFCSRQLQGMLPVSPDVAELCDSAVLVVSELLTNSVVAGAVAIELSVALHADRLSIAVTDDAPGELAPRQSRPDEPSGRGLAIVGRLCRGFGVSPRAAGKQVWADLSLPSGLIDHVLCSP